MINFLRKHLSVGVLGAIASSTILVAPSQATTLSGFSTYGNMMNGMQITVGFLDGYTETSIWNTTGYQSGGAFGSGWSLTQSGNTFGDPWSFNAGRGIYSLLINAVPGNTLFDNVDYGEVTPGSANGWNFQVISGAGPSSYTYGSPIDISRGDLFGSLLLSWGGGFSGNMRFIADADNGTSYDPVRAVSGPPALPTPPNSPPSLTGFDLSSYTILESQSVWASLYATDPNPDAINFFVNGNYVGTDGNTSGTRSQPAFIGTFADNGTFDYTGQVQDSRGAFSNTITRTVTVLNVPPTLNAFQLASNTIYEGQSASAILQATDPGADSIAFFLNGNNIGTDYATSGTRSASTDLGTFANQGTFTFTGQAQDKDGAYSNPIEQVLTVLNLDPTIINLTKDLTVRTNTLFNFFGDATDPGILDILTYDWDLNGDGSYDDFTGAAGQWSFLNPGNHLIGLRVSDGDGGFAYGSFKVEAVPEPASVLGLLTIGILGFGATRRRKLNEKVGWD